MLVASIWSRTRNILSSALRHCQPPADSWHKKRDSKVEPVENWAICQNAIAAAGIVDCECTQRQNVSAQAQGSNTNNCRWTSSVSPKTVSPHTYHPGKPSCRRNTARGLRICGHDFRPPMIMHCHAPVTIACMTTQRLASGPAIVTPHQCRLMIRWWSDYRTQTCDAMIRDSVQTDTGLSCRWAALPTSVDVFFFLRRGL